jgi:hypothetical protein
MAGDCKNSLSKILTVSASFPRGYKEPLVKFAIGETPMRSTMLCLGILSVLMALSCSAASDRGPAAEGAPVIFDSQPSSSDVASQPQSPVALDPASVDQAAVGEIAKPLPAPAPAQKPEEVLPEIELNYGENADPFKSIVAAGVPVDAARRLFDYLRKNAGAEFVRDIYTCAGKDPVSVKPCEEGKRVKATRKITVRLHPYAAIMDFTMPSSEARLFFINLKTGSVERYLTTHGKGSGNSNYAYKFSNIKDSLQTSLGIFVAGGTYYGSYGHTLRMYGMETSNDQAYNRDIVLHPAWYVSRDFMKDINPRTKKPYGRIGVSWGCPAVSKDIAKKIIPLLKNGGVILHYHKDLMEDALSGKEVKVQNPNPEVIPYPTPRPPQSPDRSKYPYEREKI